MKSNSLFAVSVLLFAVLVSPAFGQYLQPVAPATDPLLEYRQCGAPVRLVDGSIRRRSDVIYAYRKLHPCPLTGLITGACAGWQINHVIPLAKGGCDSVSNMMWLPVQIKTCSTAWCVDRWERTYYGNPYGVVVFPP